MRRKSLSCKSSIGHDTSDLENSLSTSSLQYDRPIILLLETKHTRGFKPIAQSISRRTTSVLDTVLCVILSSLPCQTLGQFQCRQEPFTVCKLLEDIVCVHLNNGLMAGAQTSHYNLNLEEAVTACSVGENKRLPSKLLIPSGVPFVMPFQGPRMRS